MKARLAVAFCASAPTLLAVSWLVQHQLRKTALALFFVMFVVDFLLLRPKPTHTTSLDARNLLPSKSVWVVGIACFLGSLSLLLGGLRAHETWEVVLACCGLLASGWGVVSFASK